MTTDITALRAKLAAATPGPWERRLYDGVSDSKSRLIKVITPPNEHGYDRVTSLADYLTSADAALIVAAVNNLPELLDRLESAAGLRATLSTWLTQALDSGLLRVGGGAFACRRPHRVPSRRYRILGTRECGPHHPVRKCRG